MNGRDIIVIGASLGGIEALGRLVRGLPPDLAAAIFVVVHLAPYAKSILPDVLSVAGALPAVPATDGAPIRHGCIYVAPPDRHLVVEGGRVGLSSGPRENFARPAVDVLFRSAARTRGAGVIGVVLSGALHDGTAGLWEIKRQGGVAVVQAPADAVAPSMPQSAIRHVAVDYVLSAAEIPGLLVRLVGPPVGAKIEDEVQATALRTTQDDRRTEQKPGESRVRHDMGAQVAGRRDSEISTFVCPEFGGSLWQANAGNLVRFRCHVGHVYSVESLVAGYGEEVERALWHAIRTLRDNANLSRQIASDARKRGDNASAMLYGRRASTDDEQASVIERVVDAVAQGNGQPSAEPLSGEATRSEE